MSKSKFFYRCNGCNGKDFFSVSELLYHFKVVHNIIIDMLFVLKGGVKE